MVSVFDHGFVTGDGVFESVLVRDGRTFALRRHLDRLEKSASIIGLAMPDRSELQDAVAAVLASSNELSAKVRITVTAGNGPLGSARGDGPPTVIVALAPLAPSREDAVRVAIAPWPRVSLGPTAGAKTISYVDNVVALSWAHEQGATETIFVDLDGNLCEGTGSNLFVVLGGRLVTPPLGSGCLAGVTRSLVIELTGAEEAAVEGSRIAEITEAFLTATSRSVQPIAWLGDYSLPHCPGPLTSKAAGAYARLLAANDEP